MLSDHDLITTDSSIKSPLFLNSYFLEFLQKHIEPTFTSSTCHHKTPLLRENCGLERLARVCDGTCCEFPVQAVSDKYHTAHVYSGSFGILWVHISGNVSLHTYLWISARFVGEV